MKFLLIFLFVNCFVFCNGRKNILFLVADDMRPDLMAYNGHDFSSSVHPPMFSPNLDALASKSLLLKRAHVQLALCSPSRTSILTGRRPDTTHVYDLDTYFRHAGGNFTTIPQYFKNHGYETAGIGKIFHPGKASGHDDPISWTMPSFHGDRNWEENHTVSWKAVPDHLLTHKPLVDKQNADQAISTLRKLAPNAKSGQKPFFLAVGFHKPHLPFVFPQSFLHHYPRSQIHVPKHQHSPINMPKVAWASFGELRSFADIAGQVSGDINSTLPAAKVKELRRAYYSSISWVDSLVGQVLSELTNLGLDDNTVVSFFGDHGYQLGEHGEWCKHTNFELATHAPMMIKIPGKTENGIVTETLTEFVDLFPTLVEAAGFQPLSVCPEDSSKVPLCTEGMSLIPLINNPNGHFKNASFSQYARHRKGFDIMGYSIRTNRYRYTEWIKFIEKPLYQPDWSTSYGVELYDHQTDTDENINRALNPKNQHLVGRLSQQLRAGWRHAIIKTPVTDIFGR